jgi:hypothetical protein
MNDNFYKSLFVVFGAGAMTLGVGCFGSDSNDDGGSGGSSGSAGSGAGTAGSGGAPAGGVVIMPDASGWVDAMAEGNTFGVQGAWYPYGDAYGEAKCMTVGMHTEAECSKIDTPNPDVMGFENVGGKMCTSGTVAKVINGPGTVMMPDYSNIWGAGIGLDLNATGGDNSVKSVFNFTEKGITGISFEIDTPPLVGLRVEFPMPATEGHADGSNYWGAGMTFPPSPVVAGVNVVKWGEVQGPRGAIAFDPSQVLSIQFHVPAGTAATGTFNYCISNLTFLTN